MYKYDRYTTAAATCAGLYWRHTVVSRLSFTKLWAACKSKRKEQEAAGAERPRRGVRGVEMCGMVKGGEFSMRRVPYHDFRFHPVSRARGERRNDM